MGAVGRLGSWKTRGKAILVVQGWVMAGRTRLTGGNEKSGQSRVHVGGRADRTSQEVGCGARRKDKNQDDA